MSDTKNVLVIKSSEWGRTPYNPTPEGELCGALYHPGAGTSCCIGIHLRSCGVPPKVMQGLGTSI